MPYNTTAIPPRKEPTGQTQLPLSRVKKVIGQDPEISLCSNNAAFVITLATEMFIQHLADEAHTQAKLERKPRRNIQYKDVANAVSHQDTLEFLEDVVPKTVPFKKVKATATATLARLHADKAVEDNRPPTAQSANGSKPHVNGDAAAFGMHPRLSAAPPPATVASNEDDPNEQLELEMRQAEGARAEDVDMTG